MIVEHIPGITEQLFKDNWPIRRRWLRIGIFALTANAQWVLYMIMTADEPNAMHVQVFMTLIGGILAIFMGFVFGAVWDDNDKRKHLGRFRPGSDWRSSDRSPVPPPPDVPGDPLPTLSRTETFEQPTGPLAAERRP